MLIIFSSANCGCAGLVREKFVCVWGGVVKFRHYRNQKLCAEGEEGQCKICAKGGFDVQKIIKHGVMMVR